MVFLALKLKSELGHSFWITVLSVFVYIFKRENTSYPRSYYYIILLYLHLISFVSFTEKVAKLKQSKVLLLSDCRKKNPFYLRPSYLKRRCMIIFFFLLSEYIIKKKQ